jgi:hypothetical protein
MFPSDPHPYVAYVLANSERVMHLCVSLAAMAVFCKVAMDEIKSFVMSVLKICLVLLVVGGGILYQQRPETLTVEAGGWIGSWLYKG